MKKVFMPCAFIMALLFLTACDEESMSMVGGHKKQRVNFYGTLTTHQDAEYPVENISIDGHVREIPFYEPVNQSTVIDDMLNVNPKDDAITKIDLVGIHEIRVPNPDKIWKYQKPETTTPPLEFVEVEVISNNTKSMNKYLVEAQKQINVDQKNAAGSTEKNVPFRALKSLVIVGHLDRDAQEAEQKRSCSLLQSASNGKKYSADTPGQVTPEVAVTCPAPRECPKAPACPVLSCPAPAPCPVCPTPMKQSEVSNDLIDGRSHEEETNDQLSRINRDEVPL